MLILKLAVRNIGHAGLRTWLNVIVLSVAFVSIVLTEGLYDGIAGQVKNAEIDFNIAGGQFWQKDYDPFNPLTFEKSHSQIPDRLNKEIAKGNAAAILIHPASIYPRNSVQLICLKGIAPDQKVINLETSALKEKNDSISFPGLIGSRMAKNSGLHIGDYVSARWRNINGTFDAGEIKIVKIFENNMPSIDKDQIWIPLEKLQQITKAFNEATIITIKKEINTVTSNSSNWVFRDQNYLLRDIQDNIERKKIYSTFFYIILIGMALLAVFDTQVLSIFKRRKEMGTLMALGMTKTNIIGLFTLEGCLTGILSFIVGSIYGIPLLSYLEKAGIPLPRMMQQSQFATGLYFYPKYGVRIYLATCLILFVSVIIVSFLPVRRITKLKPTDALRGKTS